MKARIFETTKRHVKHLAAAAAVIALAVAFTLTGGDANAQNPVELNFESINYTVREPAVDGARTNFEVGVLLSAESQTAVTVDFRTEADTAEPGQDYIDVAATLHFPPGVTRRTVSIPVLGDDLGEANQPFRIHLSNPTGAQLGNDKEGRVTIINDDANDTFRAWAEPRNNYVLESDGAAAVRVRLAGQYEFEIIMIMLTVSSGDATATAGQDYEPYSRTVRFAPYETEKTLHINILDDRKREAPELFYTLLDISGSPVHVTGDDKFTNIWIGDDDHQKAIQSTTSDTEIDLRKRHFQVAKGDTDSYHVWLTRRPTEPVTIRLNPYEDHPDLTITSDRSHTFDADNWFEPYVVTIRAAQDDDSTDGYWYIRQEVETEDPFFRNHTPGYVWVNEMDDDPSDQPTVIESETHSGVTNGITATVAYAPRQHAGRPFLVRLTFSDPVPGGYMKMRNEALTVTNGLVHESATPVTITLAGNRSCGDAGARLPDEGGRPPLDLRDRGLRLCDPGDHHAGGEPVLRRCGSGVRPERPPAGQHPDRDHPGGGLAERHTLPLKLEEYEIHDKCPPERPAEIYSVQSWKGSTFRTFRESPLTPRLNTH